MTTEQRNLILQAIGALKAALGTMPEIPFPAEPTPVAPPVADLSGKRKSTRELLRYLYSLHRDAAIEWDNAALKRQAFDLGIKLNNFILDAERHGIVEVERRMSPAGTKGFIVSFRFLKRIE